MAEVSHWNVAETRGHDPQRLATPQSLANSPAPRAVWLPWRKTEDTIPSALRCRFAFEASSAPSRFIFQGGKRESRTPHLAVPIGFQDRLLATSGTFLVRRLAESEGHDPQRLTPPHRLPTEPRTSRVHFPIHRRRLSNMLRHDYSHRVTPNSFLASVRHLSTGREAYVALVEAAFADVLRSCRTRGARLGAWRRLERCAGASSASVVAREVLSPVLVENHVAERACLEVRREPRRPFAGSRNQSTS